jgi:hypothetical protein
VHVFAVTLAARDGRAASGADLELIRDAIWAHATPHGNIEHITVTATAPGIGIGIFLNDQADDPQGQAMRLLQETARLSPVMARWRAAIESEENIHDNDNPD